MKKVLIVGAGITGLTLGYRLAKMGFKVKIVEKEKQVGGLARSFQYDGFTFDIGPHRFYTEDSEVMEFLNEILNGGFVSIPRSSGVWMFGKYYDWPFTPKGIFKLPPKVMLDVGKDIFRVHKKGVKKESFEEYIIDMYGRTIYNTFFKPYTEKFLKISPREIHSDWAIMGIDRAIIDDDMNMKDLLQLSKNAFLPKARNLTFLYPSIGGIGEFCEKLAKNIQSEGGEIFLNTPAEGIAYSGSEISGITTNKGSFTADIYIWTASLSALCNFMAFQCPELSYLSIICYNLEINDFLKTPYQWCYFGGKDVIFNRASIPSLFSSSNAPSGKTGICVEITCREGDSLWINPKSLISKIEEDLKKTNLLSKNNFIKKVYIEKISDAYPIYELDYRVKLNQVNSRLKQVKNLIVTGRTGEFWYNNMDHSIKSALNISHKLSNNLLTENSQNGLFFASK